MSVKNETSYLGVIFTKFSLKVREYYSIARSEDVMKATDAHRKPDGS